MTSTNRVDFFACSSNTLRSISVTSHRLLLGKIDGEKNGYPETRLRVIIMLLNDLYRLCAGWLLGSGLRLSEVKVALISLWHGPTLLSLSDRRSI